MEFVYELHPFDVHTDDDSGVDTDPDTDDDTMSVDEMEIVTPREICGREYAAQDIVLNPRFSHNIYYLLPNDRHERSRLRYLHAALEEILPEFILHESLKDDAIIGNKLRPNSCLLISCS